jgi:hypothetical protein
MSNETNQSAVDLFHDKVNELIVGKKTITSNDLGNIWAECKEMEKEEHNITWNNAILSFENEIRKIMNESKS